MVLSDGVPEGFKHLPGSEKILTFAQGEFDLIITVDCSDIKRVGPVLQAYRNPDIVIDHHSTTEPFGTLMLVEADAVATASILTRCMPLWGLTITLPIAANLITGLVTDTLGFRTPNTNPEVLRQTADLIALGVDMSSIVLSQPGPPDICWCKILGSGTFQPAAFRWHCMGDPDIGRTAGIGVYSE